jgi:hypothetical protein
VTFFMPPTRNQLTLDGYSAAYWGLNGNGALVSEMFPDIKALRINS